MFKYNYNVSLAEDLKFLESDPEQLRKKLESNLALKSTLELLGKELAHVKSYSNSLTSTTNLLDISIYSYKDLLTALVLSLCQYNVQAVNKNYTVLTNYCKWLNEVRVTINKTQSTAKGFVGTLNYYADNDNSIITTDLDYVERMLYKYWTFLEIDTNLKPRQRFIQALTDARQTIDPNFYLDLTESILQAIATRPDAKRKLNAMLLTTEDFKFLQTRMYLLDFDTDTISYLTYLYSNQFINYNFWSYKNYLVNYKPIGGLNLVLISLVVEAVTLILNNLNSLPNSIQQESVGKLIENPQYSDICQEIANYYALGFDACSVLGQVYPDFRALINTLYIELQKFIKVEIPSVNDYRLSPS